MTVDLKSKVLTSLRWTVGLKFGTQIINWAFTIFVMRILNPGDYGLIAMAAVFIALCQLLNEMGLGAAIVQAKEISDRMLRQVFGLVILLNAILCIALILASPLIAGLYNEPRLIKIVTVLAFQFPLMAIFVIPYSILSRELNFRPVSIVGIIAEVSSGLFTFIAALSGLGVWALVWGALVRIVVRSIGINIASPFLKLPTFDMRGFSGHAKFGGLISMQRVLWYFYSQADIFIVGKLLGKVPLGYYSVAMHLASLPMQKVGEIIHQVGLPAYSRIQDDKEIFVNYALKATRAISVISMPVFFGISSVAAVLVPAVLGSKWIPAIMPLQLLSLIVPLRILSTSLSPAIVGFGRPGVNVKILAFSCIVMPLCFLIGTRWGIIGVSIAWMIGYPIVFMYMIINILPVIGLSLKKFFAVLVDPFIFSSIMYGIVYLLRLSLEDSGINLLVLIAIMTVAGTIVYLGGMFLFRREQLFEVLNMIRKDGKEL
jgi:O-antigen/teichoic acid export membrane protein